VTERETLAEIVRKALLAGQSVEIDGLGIFQASPEGYEFLPQLRPEVFVAYVAEDLAPARRLCEALRAAGSSPWLDKDKLLPGQNWPRAIERAIEKELVLLLNLSESCHSVDCTTMRRSEPLHRIPGRLR